MERTNLILISKNIVYIDLVESRYNEYYHVWNCISLKELEVFNSYQDRDHDMNIILIDINHDLLKSVISIYKDYPIILLVDKINIDIKYSYPVLTYTHSKRELIQAVELISKTIEYKRDNDNIMDLINPKPLKLYFETDLRANNYQSIIAGVRQSKISLIIGRKGTGKNTIAYKAAYETRDINSPIITLDCRSLSCDDLFGNKTKEGIFEKFKNPIIIFDNIDLLPISLQNKICTSINQEYIITYTGKKIFFNPKFILIGTKTMNSDCYSNLLILATKSSTYTLVNLDDTPQDILPIFNGLISRLGREYGYDELMIDKEVLETMRYYKYLEDISEIEQIVRYILIRLSRRKQITINDLPIHVTANPNMVHNISSEERPLRKILETNSYNLKEMEKLLITASLKKNKYLMGYTSTDLGITQKELKEKIKKHRIH
jgi:two-component system, NtrC family, response regulator AtoC